MCDEIHRDGWRVVPPSHHAIVGLGWNLPSPIFFFRWGDMGPLEVG